MCRQQFAAYSDLSKRVIIYGKKSLPPFKSDTVITFFGLSLMIPLLKVSDIVFICQIRVATFKIIYLCPRYNYVNSFTFQCWIVPCTET